MKKNDGLIGFVRAMIKMIDALKNYKGVKL